MVERLQLRLEDVTPDHLQSVVNRYRDQLIGLSALQGPLDETASFVEDFYLGKTEVLTSDDLIIRDYVRNLVSRMIASRGKEVSDA